MNNILGTLLLSVRKLYEQDPGNAAQVCAKNFMNKILGTLLMSVQNFTNKILGMLLMSV